MQRVSVRDSAATCHRLDRVDARHRNREREFTPFFGGGIEVSLKRLEGCFNCVGRRNRFPTLNETKTNKVVPEQGRPIREPHPKGMCVRPDFIGTRSSSSKPKGADQRGNSSYQSPNSGWA